jgi:hypothetical protein
MGEGRSTKNSRNSASFSKSKAAKLANIKHGGDRKNQDRNSGLDRKQAAKALNVGERAVRDAKRVMREAPERVPDIEAGKVTVNKVLASLKPARSRRCADTYIEFDISWLLRLTTLRQLSENRRGHEQVQPRRVAHPRQGHRKP